MVLLNKKNLAAHPTHTPSWYNSLWFIEVTSGIGPYDSQRIKMTQVHCSQLERCERASEQAREGGREGGAWQQATPVRWNARGGTSRLIRM